MSVRGGPRALSIALFGEMFMAGQLTRNALSRALPGGMELSQFSVLDHLARAAGPKSPAQLAQAFHLTRGAMTNTLSKLEWAGHVHIHPDWDDARRKMVTISPAGIAARDAALAAIAPIIADVVQEIGEERIRAALPVLRALRAKFSEGG